ncbi:MAG: prolyl oligopeptidase family serine peptidase [Thermoanaerobaculia bacterium]
MRRAIAAFVGAATVALLGCASSVPTPPRHMVERSVTLPDGRRAPYLFYEPSGRGGGPPLPLILFLHGAGERGEDLDLVRREGLPRLIDSLERFPFLVAAPQIRVKHWDVRWLPDFLDAVLRAHTADRERVSVTGLSTGGIAALKVAILRPDLFSAVVAVTPDSVPRDLCRLSQIPVWIFQNARDVRVPPRHARSIARAIHACGGTTRLTMFARDGHDAWSEAYVHPGLYDWIRAQRRGL